ncbi:MAG: hypothetical protein P8Y70_12495 [Candidatus Lokiarchaeota archaeon]
MKNLLGCETCIRSGFLCTSCQEKLDEGEITPFELDLAKDLLELEDQGKYDYLSEVSFYKAIDFEDVVILIVGKKDKLRLTPDLLNWIKDVYEIDQLILVEKTNNPQSVVESLIAPGKLISLNEIFLATGDVEYKAVIKEDEKDKILFTREELEDLVLELTGKVTRIEFV